MFTKKQRLGIFKFLKKKVSSVVSASVSLSVNREFEPQIPVVSGGKKLNPYCSVLVGSSNEFKRDLQTQNCLSHNQTKET